MGAHAIVVGAGVFGLAAAIELRARGYRVTVMDPGPIPHPLAASTDISKVLRMEYGPDQAYMALMEGAFDGWRRWDSRWRAEAMEPLYHETGVLMLRAGSLDEGGFEAESLRSLLARGHVVERLDARAVRRRFPAWNVDRYVDGFFHAEGGYAESGRVVSALAAWAARGGVDISLARVGRVVQQGGRAVGVETSSGRVAGDLVVIAAGAWTAALVPELEAALRTTGHPVFHLRPVDPEPFRPERFPVFTADVARTGYYGFPANRDGIVKIANHGLGYPGNPDGPRHLPAVEEERLRTFLRVTFPALWHAEIVHRRLCFYCDTSDEDLWIARHPSVQGLTVASGGSGHAFKFAPMLGHLIADTIEGCRHPWSERFRWRPEVRLPRGLEAARYHDGGGVGSGGEPE